MGRRKSRRSWETRDIARRRRARAQGPAQTASCDKLRFTTREAAELAAELKAGTDGPVSTYPDELRPYFHNKCRGWHLTSQAPRNP